MKKIIKKTFNKIGFKIEKKYDKKYLFLQKNPEFKDFKNIEKLVLSSNYIKELKREVENFSVIENEERGGFLVTLYDLKIYIETVEEFFILKEVFIDEDYKFNTHNKVVLIDIGANIGISSLYFSKLNNIEKIYAFEPVFETHAQAKHNLLLNKEISKVEEIYNYGLGAEEREEIFLYDKNIKGNVGVRGTLSTNYSNNSSAIEQKVKIKKASSEFAKIIKANPKSKIVVKMDCEGAEYEIFENLVDSGILKSIDLFMIEWHDKGSEAIERVLLAHNFDIFPKKLTSISGMLYAVKNT